MLACCCVVLLLATGVGAEQSMQVTPLARDGRVLVTFRLSDAFNEDIRAAIHSGLTITFVYDVELQRGRRCGSTGRLPRRRSWPTVRFDNLTRRYYVTRREDGRVERADTVDREDVARDWLTVVRQAAALQQRHRSSATPSTTSASAPTPMPRNASFVWPWERGIAGLAQVHVPAVSVADLLRA